MNLNESSLRHPRTLWSIEAAMWRAIEDSSNGTWGFACVTSAKGNDLVQVFHDRRKIGAFQFFAKGHNVTDQMLAFLRSNR